MAWKKFETVDDVPKEYFDKNKSIYGLVERVIDGDTIRVRHVPGYSWRRWKNPAPLRTRRIADQTLIVRVYGVDCPEIGKFGKASQPYAQEAKDFACRRVQHRVVRITFLRKDQYRRAIGKVESVPSLLFSWIPLSRFRPADLSVDLATAGLAELYTGGGAEYCDNRPLLERRIERAKRKGKGMWALGDKRVSAADYKRGSRPGSAPAAAAAAAAGAAAYSRSPKVAIPGAQRRRTKVLDSVLTGLELAVG